MIFKTFDSNIDKISSKWGILGKSFNDIGIAIIGRITDINKAFQATDDLIGSVKDSDSIWARLYPSKENIKSQLIDVDKLIPEIDKGKASKILESIKSIENGTNEEIKSFQELYDTGDKTNQWIAEYAQSTKNQIRSTEGVIKANQQARISALAQNEAIKAQTLSAKAGKVALQGLSIALNIVALALISKGIEFIVKGIDNLAHSTEHCKKRVDDLMSSYQSALNNANSNAKTVESLASRYEKLSAGVNSLGENVSLSTDEYSEYNDIVNQIADMFPTLIQGYTSEGNAILSLKGNVEELRDTYKEAQQEAYNMLITSGKDSNGNDIINQWKNTHDTRFWADLFDFGADDVGGGISVSEALEQLKTIQNMSVERYREIKNIFSSDSKKDYDLLSDSEKKSDTAAICIMH